MEEKERENEVVAVELDLYPMVEMENEMTVAAVVTVEQEMG
jgi:hypothetical protein